MKGAVSLNLDFDYVTLERWGDALQQILAVRVNDHLQKKFRKPSTIGEVRNWAAWVWFGQVPNPQHS
jgi:hypothetical protein